MGGGQRRAAPRRAGLQHAVKRTNGAIFRGTRTSALRDGRLVKADVKSASLKCHGGLIVRAARGQTAIAPETADPARTLTAKLLKFPLTRLARTSNILAAPEFCLLPKSSAKCSFLIARVEL